MNNTPTPRTDAEIEDWVNGLNHMADDHLCCRATVVDTAELIKELRRERNQLREVCDELAESGNGIKHNIIHGYDNCKYSDQQCNCGIIPLKQKFDSALESYNQLPHVLERKTK